jgi:hypothetical protein
MLLRRVAQHLGQRRRRQGGRRRLPIDGLLGRRLARLRRRRSAPALQARAEPDGQPALGLAGKGLYVLLEPRRGSRAPTGRDPVRFETDGGPPRSLAAGRRRRRLGSAAHWVLREPQVDQLARGLHRSLCCWRLHLRRSRERRPCVPTRLSHGILGPNPNADMRARTPCTECYCGSKLNASGNVGSSAPDSACQAVACPGDGTQACGGSWLLRLFESTKVATASSSTSAPATSSTGTALPSGWQSQGCTSTQTTFCVRSALGRELKGRWRFTFPIVHRRHRRLAPSPVGVVHEPEDNQHPCGLHRSLRCRRLQLRRHAERRPCVDPGSSSGCSRGASANRAFRAAARSSRMLLRLDAQRLAAACPGDASQKCGGPFYMRLFKSSPVAAPTSSSAPIASSTAAAVPPGWQLKGCTFD